MEVQGKRLANQAIWDNRTKIATESRPTTRGYVDPQHNPEGRLVTYTEPSGRGSRYDQLITEHVATTVSHDQATEKSTAGRNLRTVRRFTNPAPYFEKGKQAEAQRDYQDKIGPISKATATEAKRRLKMETRDSQMAPKPSVDKTDTNKA